MVFEPRPVRQRLILDPSGYVAGSGEAISSANTLRDAMLTSAAAVVVARGVIDALSAAVSELADQITATADVQRTRNIFQAVTRDIGGMERVLQRLRSATRGAVSDTDLMTAASKALRSGVAKTTEDLIRLAQEARGPGLSSLADAWDRIGATVRNAVDRVRLWIANSPELNAALRVLGDRLNDVLGPGGRLDELLASLTGPDGSIPALRDGIFTVLNVLERATVALFELRAQFFQAVADLAGQVLPRITQVIDSVAGSLAGVAQQLGIDALVTGLGAMRSQLEAVNNAGQDIATEFSRRAREAEGDITSIREVFGALRTDIDAAIEAGITPPGDVPDAGDLDPERNANRWINNFGRVIGAAQQLNAAFASAAKAMGKESETLRRIQLGVVAALSVANAIKETAAGFAALDPKEGGPAVAASHFISAAAYATAASVAGAQAAGLLPSGAPGGAAVPQLPEGVEDEDREGRQIQVRLVVQGNLVADRDWIADSLAPALSEVVRDDRAVLVATQSRSATRVEERIRTET